MGKICLSVALTVVCVFSTFAQSNRKFSQNDERISPAVNVAPSDKTENVAESARTATVDTTEEMEFQKTRWNALAPDSTFFKYKQLVANNSLGAFTTGNAVID